MSVQPHILSRSKVASSLAHTDQIQIILDRHRLASHTLEGLEWVSSPHCKAEQIGKLSQTPHRKV